MSYFDDDGNPVQSVDPDFDFGDREEGREQLREALRNEFAMEIFADAVRTEAAGIASRFLEIIIENPSENSRIPRDQGLRRSIIRIIAT